MNNSVAARFRMMSPNQTQMGMGMVQNRGVFMNPGMQQMQMQRPMGGIPMINNNMGSNGYQMPGIMPPGNMNRNPILMANNPQMMSPMANNPQSPMMAQQGQSPMVPMMANQQEMGQQFHGGQGGLIDASNKPGVMGLMPMNKPTTHVNNHQPMMQQVNEQQYNQQYNGSPFAKKSNMSGSMMNSYRAKSEDTQNYGNYATPIETQPRGLIYDHEQRPMSLHQSGTFSSSKRVKFQDQTMGYQEKKTHTLRPLTQTLKKLSESVGGTSIVLLEGAPAYLKIKNFVSSDGETYLKEGFSGLEVVIFPIHAMDPWSLKEVESLPLVDEKNGQIVKITPEDYLSSFN